MAVMVEIPGVNYSITDKEFPAIKVLLDYSATLAKLLSGVSEDEFNSEIVPFHIEGRMIQKKFGPLAISLKNNLEKIIETYR